MESAVDAGTAENKKSISLHSPSSERNLKPCGMTFTPSAPGNTIGMCHLPSGGGSALNQTQSLTSRCNLGNTFPGQVRESISSTFLEIATDDDIWYLCAAQTVLSSNTVKCSCLYLVLAVPSALVLHLNLSYKCSQAHATASTRWPA